MSLLRISRRTNNGNAIAEFGPTLWIFFIIFILPLVDLMSFMWGVGTVMMVADLGARKACGAMKYSDAIKIVNGTEADLANFRSYANVVPSNGATHGVTVNIIGYPTATGATGAVTRYAPPPVKGRIPVDRTTLDATIYHYQVVAAYDVMPIFNFKGMPFFSTIPGLGAAIPITFSSSVNVEHPEGLND
jgi:hypothetical protein